MELLDDAESLKQRLLRILIPDLQNEMDSQNLKMLEKKIDRAEVVSICWEDLNGRLETLKQRFQSLPPMRKGEKTARAWISSHLTFKWLSFPIGHHKLTLQKLDRAITKLESARTIKFL